MTGLIMAAQLILGLSILVILHELGHYFFARLFKIRVEKFYLFFNPKISIVRAKRINGKWQVKFFAKNVPSNMRAKQDEQGNVIADSKGRPIWEQIPLEELPDNDWRRYPESTEWGIGWLPFGGYCGIAGMVDETKTADQMSASQPQPWEFRSKPAWQRLLVMLGGVLMNFILGCILFIFITYHYEGGYLPNSEVSRHGIYAYENGKTIGFRTGDKIVAVDGKKVTRFKDTGKTGVYFGATITVERNGETIDVVIPDSAYKMLQHGPFFTYMNYPVIVDSVSAGRPADRGNMQKGDIVLSVNGEPVSSLGKLQEELAKHLNSDITVDVLRSNDTVALNMHLESSPLLGFFARFPYQMKHYSLGEAIKFGLNDATDMLSANMKGLGNVIKGRDKASESLSGPIGIATIYGGTWDWARFWLITAMLSLVLAFMNLLPIPALDGGHVLFLLYEMISRKKPSDKFMEYAQLAGMFILFALMFFVIGNDIFKLFK